MSCIAAFCLRLIFSQCEYGKYHISPEYGIAEVVDENCNAVQSGKMGELICTGFLNNAMPFIRYKTGDSVVLLNWLVDIGDDIKIGQQIAEIETDKATMELESAVSGKLSKKIVSEGESAGIGSVIAMVESEQAVETIYQERPLSKSFHKDLRKANKRFRTTI